MFFSSFVPLVFFVVFDNTTENVGSNIFNILGVLGISSLVAAEGVSVSAAAFRLDMPVMIAVAVACLPIFFTGHLIARWEGALLLAYYCAYTAAIVIAATVPSLTGVFAAVMLGVVIPLTVITLVTGVVRFIRNGGNPESAKDSRSHERPDTPRNRPRP